jgi:hypothetical protein
MIGPFLVSVVILVSFTGPRGTQAPSSAAVALPVFPVHRGTSGGYRLDRFIPESVRLPGPGRRRARLILKQARNSPTHSPAPTDSPISTSGSLLPATCTRMTSPGSC